MDEPTSTPGASNAVTPGHTNALYHNELQKRKLTTSEAAKYGLTFVDRMRVRELVGGRSADAIGIPYYDLAGNPIPDFVRVRYLGAVPEHYNKYAQRKGSGTHYYFPRGFDWQAVASNPYIDLIITEGEFKALAIAQALEKEGLSSRMAVCAVAGVSCALAKGQAKLHPDLDPFKWVQRSGSSQAGRKVYIAYDYDGANKGNGPGEPRPEVAQAEAQLVVLLKGAGASVMLCRVGNFAPTPNQKWAVDDFLHSGRHFAELMMGAHEPQHVNAATSKHRLYEFAAKFGLMGAKYIELTTGREYSLHDMQVVTGSMYYVDTGPRGGQQVKYIYDDYRRWSKAVRLVGRTMDPRYMGRKITPDGFYNACPDFPLQPIAGDITPWLTFTKYFFADDPDLETLWHQWVAHVCQLPWIKQHTCWQFLSSETGVGKSFIAEWAGKMFGGLTRFLGPDDAFEKHNTMLDGVLWLVVNEPSSDFESHANQIKHLVTSEKLIINTKNQVQYEVPNYLNCIFTSNRPYVSPMERDARREIVYSPRSADKMVVKDLVAAVKEWCEKEQGLQKMFHYYCCLDLTNYDPKAPAPMTDDKEQAASLSQNTYVSFVNTYMRMVRAKMDDPNEALCVDLISLRALYTVLEGGFGKSATTSQLQRAFYSYSTHVEFIEGAGGAMFVYIGNLQKPKWSKLDEVEQQRLKTLSFTLQTSLAEKANSGALSAVHEVVSLLSGRSF